MVFKLSNRERRNAERRCGGAYIAKYIRKQSDESGGVHGREQNGHGTVNENGDGTIID